MSALPEAQSLPAAPAVLAWKGPRSLEEVRRQAGGTVWWAMSTCWWTVQKEHLYRHPVADLPCDPRGSMLMMSDVEEFLEQAGANWGHCAQDLDRLCLSVLDGNEAEMRLQRGLGRQSSGIASQLDPWRLP